MIFKVRVGLEKSDKILKEVCRHSDLTMEEIFSRTRKPRIVYPRMLAMFLIRRHTDLSLQDIADIFEMDHSNVIHACGRVEGKLDEDESLRALISKIMAKEDPDQMAFDLSERGNR